MASKLSTKEKQEVAVPQSRKLRVGPEDIDVQRINLIQKQSDLVEDAPVGSIYINRSQMIVSGEGDGIPVTVIKGDKMWKEDIPYDSDEIPRFAHTHEEFLELKKDSEYDVIECADITVLITQPEGESNPEAYPYPLGDLKVNVGKFHVHKDAYRCTYKRLATYETFNPSQPVWALKWKFGTELIKKGKYTWYVPTLISTEEKSSKEIMEFCDNIWEAA